MGVLLIAGLSAVAFILAYRLYGRWLGQRVFRLAAERLCPSAKLADGIDFVPTPRTVVLGHHFTSIAGTGPIVGPAIAVMWGWLPAVLWVVFGSIFIGAVHDFGSLVVSLRNDGQTIGDVAGRLLNRRVRVLFLLILFIGLTIVLAIFGLVIAVVFRMFPAAIFPCVVQIPLAVTVGMLLTRKGVGLFWPSAITLVLMYVSVVFGDVGWLGTFNAALAGLPTMGWVLLLLGYCFVASVLPVGVLLQPRDYINALQLITALGLVLVGLIVAGCIGGAPVEGTRPPLEIVAPMVDFAPPGAPLMLPFLFITIACGAISGFHCLVASGTTSKQIRRETDAVSIGYGAMIMEGFLAVLVILACVAGLGLGSTGSGGQVVLGEAAWAERYASWASAGGLGSKVAAFVDGAGNFLGAMAIPSGVALALMGVLVASFAATTLDTACRLQRYVTQELTSTIGDSWRRAAWSIPGRYVATAIAVVLAAGLAAIPFSGGAWTWTSTGTGGLILWPLFGATNQLLAGLAFLVIAFFLWRGGRPAWFLIIPMAFMLVIPAWAMGAQIFTGTGADEAWIAQDRWLLVGIGVATLGLEVWMIVEAALLWPRVRLAAASPSMPCDSG
ncbi:MAG: carbon starvation protein A [Phycisphaerales bacterium]|nr:carbon starvation protein A [Phycisphaerales bacterium]